MAHKKTPTKLERTSSKSQKKLHMRGGMKRGGRRKTMEKHYPKYRCDNLVGCRHHWKEKPDFAHSSRRVYIQLEKKRSARARNYSRGNFGSKQKQAGWDTDGGCGLKKPKTGVGVRALKKKNPKQQGLFSAERTIIGRKD